jgi:hypothetical protein
VDWIRRICRWGTVIGRSWEDADCFSEEIDAFEDKESWPRAAKIGNRIQEGEIRSPNNGIGDLRVKRRGTDKHDGTALAK